MYMHWLDIVNRIIWDTIGTILFLVIIQFARSRIMDRICRMNTVADTSTAKQEHTTTHLQLPTTLFTTHLQTVSDNSPTTHRQLLTNLIQTSYNTLATIYKPRITKCCRGLFFILVIRSSVDIRTE